MKKLKKRNKMSTEEQNKETAAKQVSEHAAKETAQAESAAEAAGEEKKEETDDSELTEEVRIAKELEETKVQLETAKKDYLFLLAEFDNFRKRTLKEKAELIKNAGEGAMKELLPIIDDFERALQAIKESSDIGSVKEGVGLIYNKFVKYLEKNGVKPIESTDKDFNTEFHEAVTVFPTDDESKKGKVIDTVQKGYTMNDKVLRHSKVVVGK